jgi:hypothetical protein
VFQIIQTDGPVFWRSFVDFLGKYVEDMKADLAGDVTLREGPLTFSMSQAADVVQASISKSAFPQVAFTAIPNYQQRSAQVSYVSKNPRTHGSGVGMTQMPCRFEVSQHDKVYLQLDGKPCHEPHEAAKHVMEKLFTIPG